MARYFAWECDGTQYGRAKAAKLPAGVIAVRCYRHGGYHQGHPIKAQELPEELRLASRRDEWPGREV